MKAKGRREKLYTLFFTVPSHYTHRIFIHSFQYENNFPEYRNLVHLQECNWKDPLWSELQNRYFWPFFLLLALAQKLGWTTWNLSPRIDTFCNSPQFGVTDPKEVALKRLYLLPWGEGGDRQHFLYITRRTSPKCGTLTWWGGLSGLIKY